MKRITLTRRPAVAKDSRMDQRETRHGKALGPGGRLLPQEWRKRPARLGGDALSWHAFRRPVLTLAAALPLYAALSGCITVSAPDKPIVIELNINIKQEVIYRLNADAGKTIDDNKGIF